MTVDAASEKFASFNVAAERYSVALANGEMGDGTIWRKIQIREKDSDDHGRC